jgi:2,3-bisphosphoglycerate-dependent phosphoglycerate mutase
MRVFLLRHGETDWNRAGRIQGHLDVALNALGLAQAAALGQTLAPMGISKIIASPLRRAFDTAQALAKTIKLEPVLEPRIKEQSYGSRESKTFAEWQQIDAAEYTLYRNGDEQVKPGGGESRIDVITRCKAAMNEHAELAAAEGHHTIALFTHGGVVSAWWRQINELPINALRTWNVPNAGINEFYYEPASQAWTVVRFGDTTHLQHLSAVETMDA